MPRWQQRIPIVERPCARCGGPIPDTGRGPGEYARRRFCGGECRSTALSELRRAQRGPLATPAPALEFPPIPLSFPGAQHEAVADAPARCVCGAVWGIEDGALACAMCGRRVYVRELLRDAVSRRGFIARGASTLE